MGTLNYALNHTRKEAFALGKLLYFREDDMPKTFHAFHAEVWSQIDPEHNHVDKDYGTPELAMQLAVALWEFGVEGTVSDTQDELIQDKYFDYVIRGSVYTPDADIGDFMFMGIDHEKGTMVVNTATGLQRRRIKEIELHPYDFNSRYQMPSRVYVPEMAENERLMHTTGNQVPFIQTVQKSKIDELEELHDLAMEISTRLTRGEGVSIDDENVLQRYQILIQEMREKHNL
jgi:hypothetical protein